MKPLLEFWAKSNISLTTGLEFDIYHTADIDIQKMLQAWLLSLKNDETTPPEETLASITVANFCKYICQNTGEDSFAVTEEQWQELIPATYN